MLNKKYIETSHEHLNDLMRIFHNSSHPKIHPFVTVAQWNEYWSHSDEKIACSILVLHYGHYTLHTFSLVIFSVKCDLLNLLVKNSPPIERWKQGVSIMLEKAPENHTVED